jgi:hypothetical protein
MCNSRVRGVEPRHEPCKLVVAVVGIPAPAFGEITAAVAAYFVAAAAAAAAAVASTQ